MPTLNWLTREADNVTVNSVPYRLLEEDAVYSSGQSDTGNMLIQGDNLEALKALMPFYAGQVKCIYIDPPYNTRAAFEHYDDNVEHSYWLSILLPRLQLLRELLSDDGSIWVSIDDNEAHYLKVLMDETFGRMNFVANVVWQKLYTVKNSAKYLSDMHDHILVYSKSKNRWKRNLLPRSERAKGDYQNPDNDLRGDWTTNAIQARNFYSLGTYEIKSPSGRVHRPPVGTYWRISKKVFEELDNDGRIWWGKSGNAVPRVKKFLSEAKEGVVPATWWNYSEAGTNAEAKEEVRNLLEANVEIFLTPKPEKLIKQILTIATDPGDLVLDSFLGSGTSAAVAQKMGRRWIGIEIGEHAVTHCAPRLRKVINGEQGGISELVNWNGGGGFKFYRLGPAAFDEDGRIHPDITFSVLAAHVWFSETLTPWVGESMSPLLGIHDGKAITLLYNDVLRNNRIVGENVLTRGALSTLRNEISYVEDGFAGFLIVYGEHSRLSASTLKREHVIFKQIPYDIESRS